ncbi:MAG: hypothetical protein HQ574_02685 [Chloroflexi bacterium]|nr:hypothetical protein [Chloroflexota bacterium]
MLSRVYIALGKSEEMEDFDLAFAQEGLARAYALTGKLGLAKIHLSKPTLLGKQIEDPEDRQIFEEDLNGGDWYQLG